MILLIKMIKMQTVYLHYILLRCFNDWYAGIWNHVEQLPQWWFHGLFLGWQFIIMIIVKLLVDLFVEEILVILNIYNYTLPIIWLGVNISTTQYAEIFVLLTKKYSSSFWKHNIIIINYTIKVFRKQILVKVYLLDKWHRLPPVVCCEVKLNSTNLRIWIIGLY